MEFKFWKCSNCVYKDHKKYVVHLFHATFKFPVENKLLVDFYLHFTKKFLSIQNHRFMLLNVANASKCQLHIILWLWVGGLINS